VINVERVNAGRKSLHLENAGIDSENNINMHLIECTVVDLILFKLLILVKIVFSVKDGAV
jgi:hypothetical protein